MSNAYSSLIDDLVRRRKEAGLTQFRLAELASLPQSAIARIESKRSVPQTDTLLKIVEALGCELVMLP